MGFDFDAFAGAVWTLSEVFDKTAEKAGIPRQALTRALYRYATARMDKWEAELWKNAHSQKELANWIRREAGRDFDGTKESEMLKLARGIPGRIRKNLIEIAKSLATPRGGNPRKLDFAQSWEVRRRVQALREKGLPKEKAYDKVARQLKGISAHTVRRECEPKERQRSRQPKDSGIAFITDSTAK
jgi:hypothetical protein